MSTALVVVNEGQTLAEVMLPFGPSGDDSRWLNFRAGVYQTRDSALDSECPQFPAWAHKNSDEGRMSFAHQVEVPIGALTDEDIRDAGAVVILAGRN